MPSYGCFNSAHILPHFWSFVAALNAPFLYRYLSSVVAEQIASGCSGEQTRLLFVTINFGDLCGKLLVKCRQKSSTAHMLLALITWRIYGVSLHSQAFLTIKNTSFEGCRFRLMSSDIFLTNYWISKVVTTIYLCLGKYFKIRWKQEDFNGYGESELANMNPIQFLENS